MAAEVSNRGLHMRRRRPLLPPPCAPQPRPTPLCFSCVQTEEVVESDEEFVDEVEEVPSSVSACLRALAIPRWPDAQPARSLLANSRSLFAT